MGGGWTGGSRLWNVSGSDERLRLGSPILHFKSSMRKEFSVRNDSEAVTYRRSFSILPLLRERGQTGHRGQTIICSQRRGRESEGRRGRRREERGGDGSYGSDPLIEEGARTRRGFEDTLIARIFAGLDTGPFGTCEDGSGIEPEERKEYGVSKGRLCREWRDIHLSLQSTESFHARIQERRT